MRHVKSVVYRYLTHTDFFNLYKPKGTEETGGGQKYIDFPVGSVSKEEWEGFVGGVDGLVEKTAKNGPYWTFPVQSIGVAPQQAQTVSVYQRRNPTFSIPRQHIHSSGANRVVAWHPDYGFPEPQEPAQRDQLPPGLVVYLARTDEGEVWAGWFRNCGGLSIPCRDAAAEVLLRPMVALDTEPRDAGIVKLDAGALLLDETDRTSPFAGSPGATAVADAVAEVASQQDKTDESLLGRLFAEDTVSLAQAQPEVRERIQRVRRRNQRASKGLKELYGYTCQVTGEPGFAKAPGGRYIEAHHLVHLGDDGDDGPLNLIVVNPTIHRMLHYASVEGLELQNIEEAADGTASLQVTINGQPYTIRWHAAHAQRILQHQESQQT